MPKVEQDFSIGDYQGVWYEMLRSKGNDFEKGDCVMANYSMGDDGYLSVLNSQQQRDANGELLARDYAEGYGKFMGSEDEGRLGVKFS